MYPLLDGDRCWWLAADFDGPDALTEALMYLKAGRSSGVPVALEVSRAGIGLHAWTFFTAPVAAETARRLGTGLLREAMAIRGRVNLASYDRLFPSQDLLPAGGAGNLIALPLFRAARDRNATVFLNLESLEPHQDQWSYLSMLDRMTPRETARVALRPPASHIRSPVRQDHPKQAVVHLPGPGTCGVVVPPVVTSGCRSRPRWLMALADGNAAEMLGAHDAWFGQDRRGSWFCRAQHGPQPGDLPALCRRAVQAGAAEPRPPGAGRACRR